MVHLRENNLSDIYLYDNGNHRPLTSSSGWESASPSISLSSPVLPLGPTVSRLAIRETIMCPPKPFSCACHYLLHCFWNIKIHLCEGKNEPVLVSKNLSCAHSVLTLEDVSCLSLWPMQYRYRDSQGNKWRGHPELLPREIPQKKIFNHMLQQLTHSLCEINDGCVKGRNDHSLPVQCSSSTVLVVIRLVRQ